MKEITKLPFRKGSIRNFLFEARFKKGITQRKFARKMNCSKASVSDYENGTRKIPASKKDLFIKALGFNNNQIDEFEKFIKAVERKRTQRGVVGSKTHAPFKRNGNTKKEKKFFKLVIPKKPALKKNAKKKVKKKRVKGLITSEERIVLRFLVGFLNKREGKEALNLLMKVIKVVRK